MIHASAQHPRKVFLLGLATWLLVTSTIAAAQDTTKALPASLLRRLAEVTDGQGLANEVYIVAQFAFPHEVMGVFATRAEAVARTRGAIGLGVFGPFRPVLPDFPKRFFMCPHDGTKSEYRICPERPIPLTDVRTVTITARLTNGDSMTVTYPAMSVDAVFFTLDAMDKFAFDYYVRLVGLEEANRMRQELISRLRSRE